MNWLAHVLFGFISGAIAAYFLNIDYVLLVFAVLGALAPDIDHDSSKIRRMIDWSFPVLAFFMAYSYFKALNGIVFVYALALIGVYHMVITYLKPRHRGITHTFVFAFIISAMVYFLFSFNAGVLFFIGYISHLIADTRINF